MLKKYFNIVYTLKASSSFIISATLSGMVIQVQKKIIFRDIYFIWMQNNICSLFKIFLEAPGFFYYYYYYLFLIYPRKQG